MSLFYIDSMFDSMELIGLINSRTKDLEYLYEKNNCWLLLVVSEQRRKSFSICVLVVS